MKEEELKFLSIERLCILTKKEIKNLEHYIIRSDLYNQEKINETIKDLYVINSVISYKIKKLNDKRKKQQCH